MKPTVTILIGAPLSGDEARFLHKLHADLAATGALILANFVVDERQIDFFVVTPTCAALLELKNFPRPIFGERNGVWKYLDAGGTRVRYAGMNPWQQTLKQKYALSDAMKEYQRRTPDVPASSGAFYSEFAGFVCIYPAIHARSQVTAGDHKVEVRSYSEILDAIRGGGKPSTWSVDDWERFAEKHLSLAKVTLAEATDSRILDAQEALHAYRERIRTILGSGLPPLIDDAGSGVSSGAKLITLLLEPQNRLLVGPSGSAKTFHLHHAALAIASSDTELPLLVEAAKYRGGDFWSVLRQGTAPFFREDPRELLDAIRLCGVKPVLLVDAVNECADVHVSDLLKGVQAFALRFDSRVVLTSQVQVELAADLKAETLSLELPNDSQKQTIYAHHAGLDASPDLDRFCAGFTNAYDLTVAGRCHSVGSSPRSRVALYDRYVRQCLPQHTSVLTALLRTLSAAMSGDIALSITRDKFDSIAERVLTEQSVPLGLIDTLAASRLVRVSGDSFAFEHELLAKYFRAEVLRRSVEPATGLAAELARPINQDLVEYMIPRFTTPEDVAEILAATTDVQLLSDACSGGYGTTAQRVLLDQADQVLDAALADIPNVSVRCVSVPADNGRRRLADVQVAGTRTWTSRDLLLCDVISRNLDQPPLREKFLNLLDVTEWTLRAAVYAAATESRFKSDAVWAETVRLYGGVLIWGTLKIPSTAILCGLRNLMMRWHHHKRGIPIREQLIQRVNRDPMSHFALLAVLQDRQAAYAPELVAENIELVKTALASDIYILQIDALEFAQSMNSAVRNSSPELIDRVRQMLDGFETENIMINTVRLEALASYDGLEIGMTGEDAAAEMRRLIAPGAVDDAQLAEIAKMCQVTPRDWLASQAYGCLGKIFEDIFQGIYCEAYDELENEEKASLLSLAALGPDVGWLSDWMLQELLKIGDERALPVYQRFASQVSSSMTAMVQEAVAAYELGIAGCARWSDAPPKYEGDDSPAHQAWRTIGEILFWIYRSRITGATPPLESLWARLDGEALIAAGDVIYQFAHAEWRLRDGVSEGPNLARHSPAEVRRVVLACLSRRGALPSIFPHGAIDGGPTGFLLSTLGEVGTAIDIPVLLAFVEDPQLGRTAVAAIERINKVAVERAPSVG